MNRGDPQSGWDTDQFPTNAEGTALAMYCILKSGGLGTGGLNFDAKVRRQSIDLADLVLAHAGAMDVCARPLLVAVRLVEEETVSRPLAERYAGWDAPDNVAILAGERTLAELADSAERDGIDPKPRFGRQERLENAVARTS